VEHFPALLELSAVLVQFADLPLGVLDESCRVFCFLVLTLVSSLHRLHLVLGEHGGVRDLAGLLLHLVDLGLQLDCKGCERLLLQLFLLHELLLGSAGAFRLVDGPVCDPSGKVLI